MRNVAKQDGLIKCVVDFPCYGQPFVKVVQCCGIIHVFFHRVYRKYVVRQQGDKRGRVILRNSLSTIHV